MKNECVFGKAGSFTEAVHRSQLEHNIGTDRIMIYNSHTMCKYRLHKTKMKLINHYY